MSIWSIFDKCGDSGIPVATFVANIFKLLDNVDLHPAKKIRFQNFGNR